MKALERIGVPYRAVVEEDEAEQYIRVLGRRRVLVQPTHGRGLVVTRNWIWDHAAAFGAPRFWTMDDNIKGFYRFNRNLKTPITSGTILRVMEDWTDRYANVPISGMNYFMFCSRKEPKIPAYYLNTRVYSNMLIRTNVADREGRPFRNEGFYNDDTDLCLRILKDGRFCTALFNAFLIWKVTTMTVKGGMTPHYKDEETGRKEDDGRWKMAEELRLKHPDLTTITRKWGRWQHQVDYSRFQTGGLAPKLKLAPGVEVPEGTNDYGMAFQRRNGSGRWITVPTGTREAPEDGGDHDRAEAQTTAC